ncbi:hypothetical protein TIFTF001_053359 [Ficus carica]|uniref:Uncharacterized protein n=1 Tax=Ficus carica TaxID=3494 RepID=A0AA88EAJ5_FICCA|nr:hypothetical protein TIFTF001_053359 [Ficus carica]
MVDDVRRASYAGRVMGRVLCSYYCSFGPLPDEDADVPYRDPKIYNDMYLGRYLGYAADWRAYPNESMEHYCRRFQDVMLPYIPQDLGMTVEHMINDIMEAEIIAHMLQVDALVDDIIQVLVDDAGIPEPLFEGGPCWDLNVP